RGRQLINQLRKRLLIAGPKRGNELLISPRDGHAASLLRGARALFDDLFPYVRELLVEQRIAAIAGRQPGVIAAVQLLACGMSTSAISRASAAGRLHRIYRGVYAVGHLALSLEANWQAATLSCGEGSVLSHRSAAELWRMLEPQNGSIHVAVLTPGG